MIDYYETKLSQDLGHIQLVCSVNDDKYEDIMSYNDIINHIGKQEDQDIFCKSKLIVSHEGPLI